HVGGIVAEAFRVQPDRLQQAAFFEVAESVVRPRRVTKQRPDFEWSKQLFWCYIFHIGTEAFPVFRSRQKDSRDDFYYLFFRSTASRFIRSTVSMTACCSGVGIRFFDTVLSPAMMRSTAR